MYTDTASVYRHTSLTTSEISDANMQEFILDAEVEVDRETFTTYWVAEDTGTASAGANSTLTDSTKTWTTNDYAGDYIWIYGGTGINQLEKIESNTGTILTIDTTWTTNPDATSTYRIIHCGHDPRKTEVRVGDGTRKIFTNKYPIRYLSSVTIDDTSVTTSYITQTDAGGLYLSTDAEMSSWYSDMDPKNSIVYWYGVYEIPREIKLLTALKASMYALESQMGGTFNDPTSFSLPEGQVGLGEPYINIRSTLFEIKKRHDIVLSKVMKYPRVFTY